MSAGSWVLTERICPCGNFMHRRGGDNPGPIEFACWAIGCGRTVWICPHDDAETWYEPGTILRVPLWPAEAGEAMSGGEELPAETRRRLAQRRLAAWLAVPQDSREWFLMLLRNPEAHATEVDIVAEEAALAADVLEVLGELLPR
jgi:hypothetical protein